MSIEPDWVPREENQFADYLSRIVDYDNSMSGALTPLTGLLIATMSKQRDTIAGSGMQGLRL